MNYNEFKEFIKEHVKDALPEEYQSGEVQIREAEKNNGLILDGLTVLRQGENVSPIIYLNSLFEQYKGGLALDEIIKDIGAAMKTNKLSNEFRTGDVLDFEKAKDNIILRVVGYEANREKLEHYPHKRQEDMAFTYHVLIGKEEAGTATAPINENIFDQYGISVEELHQLAMKNTAEKFPLTMQSMEEVIKGIMGAEMFGENFQESEELKAEMDAVFQEMTGGEAAEIPMYVVSNEIKVNGAASLFYPGAMEQIAERLGGNFLVLPSSTHETIIVPDDGKKNYLELKEMVKEINDTQVEPEEVLTNQVYTYDCESKVFEPAEKKAARKVEKPSIMDKLKANKENMQERESKKAAIPKRDAEMEL